MIIDGQLKIMIEIIDVHVNVSLEYRYFLLNDSRKRTESEPNSLLGLMFLLVILQRNLLHVQASLVYYYFNGTERIPNDRDILIAYKTEGLLMSKYPYFVYHGIKR
jgi:hypothetical protein